MKMYTAAYRNQRGEIQSSGMPTPVLEVAERAVVDANADELAVLFFVAYLDEPKWQEL